MSMKQFHKFFVESGSRAGKYWWLGPKHPESEPKRFLDFFGYKFRTVWQKDLGLMYACSYFDPTSEFEFDCDKIQTITGYIRKPLNDEELIKAAEIICGMFKSYGPGRFSPGVVKALLKGLNRWAKFRNDELNLKQRKYVGRLWGQPVIYLPLTEKAFSRWTDNTQDPSGGYIKKFVTPIERAARCKIDVVNQRDGETPPAFFKHYLRFRWGGQQK